MRRVAFLVDGFNLYHSLRVASGELGGTGTRWLDLRSLCRSFLHIVGGGAEISEIRTFTALARHREQVSPGTVSRHVAFLECLRATGIAVDLGHFKGKFSRCLSCGADELRHEEKETDVAIAVGLLELMIRDRCDVAVLVSGDSALAPAVRSSLRLFPKKPVLCAFPYRRQSLELKAAASGSFLIGKERYVRHQLPDPFTLPDGRILWKPPGW